MTERSRSVVIIGGDIPQEFLGTEVREKKRLTIGDCPASFQFLKHFFDCGKDSQEAARRWKRESLRFVSLNAPWLATMVQEAGWKPLVVPLYGPGRLQIETFLTRHRPRVAVLSTTFLPLAAQIDAIAQDLRRQDPEIFIIAGGPQVWKSWQHQELVRRGEIDAAILPALSEHNYLIDKTRPSPVDALVVAERGEATLLRILKALETEEKLDDLPNLSLWREGAWTTPRMEVEKIRPVCIDWSMQGVKDPIFFPIQAGRGCAHRCTFCDFCGMIPKVETRPTPDIIAELRSIPLISGCRRAYFTDDNLFNTKPRALALLRAIIGAKLDLRWRGMARLDIIDAEVAELMRESGCVEMLLGVESGDADQLERMGKRIRPDQILTALEQLAHQGINTKSTFIIGFPGETPASVDATIDLLNAYPVHGPAIHRYTLFSFAVLPLSQVARGALRQRYGLRGYGFHWHHNTMDSKEAAVQLERALDSLCPELVPTYVLETPELPGYDIEDLKTIVVIRNRLALATRDGRTQEAADLWKELEQVFLR